MVFLESFKMSSSKVHQAPSPPTVEQILEDLSAASDEDVIFKSVILEHGAQTKKELKEGKLKYVSRFFCKLFCTVLCIMRQLTAL